MLASIFLPKKFQSELEDEEGCSSRNRTIGDCGLRGRRRAASIQESQLKRRKDPRIMSCENLEGMLVNLSTRSH